VLTLRIRAGAAHGSVAAALLAILVSAALFQAFSVEQASDPARSDVTRGFSARRSPAAQEGRAAAKETKDPAYSVTRSGTGFQAYNPAQRLHVRFRRGGVQLSSGDLHFSLRLRAAGYGGSLEPVLPVAPRGNPDLVLDAHVGIDEWYANGPAGLEQGFTITRELPRGTAGPLALALSVSGNARMARDNRGVTLSDSRGRSLRYTGLAATDARGRRLHSWLELRRGELLVRVDRRGAQYPLRIDPLIEQAPLSVGYEGFAFGTNVAISSDGTVALAGKDIGAVWSFRRSGSTWTEQEQLSLPGGKELVAESVALSSDGNVAVIGSPQDNGGIGAVWVFRRSGATWKEQEKISGGPEIGEEGKARFGASAALSSDGNIALIAAPGESGEKGAAWIFTPLAPGSHLHRKLGPEGECLGEFGASVALSADGARALVGCPGRFLVSSAVMEFIRQGESRWQLYDIAREGGEDMGSSLALSANGNTLLASGGMPNFVDGAASLFTRPPSTTPAEWGAPREALVGSEAATCHLCGFKGGPVALSADGTTAVIGASGENLGVGAAWVFRLTGSSSIQQGPRIGGLRGQAELGRSVAVSADGNIVLIGEPGFVSPYAPGDVRVFVNPPPSVTTNGAANVGISTATLNAIVNPNERATTTYFQYGTTEMYGQAAPGPEVPAAGSVSSLTASLGGLLPATTYHFRAVAESSAGTTYGVDQAFKTLPLPPPPLAPVNNVLPEISGAAIRGQALSVSQGSWANHPTSFTYAWQTCNPAGNSCSNLSGATGPAHILTKADVGHRLRAVVTAANAAGSSSASSAVSASVGSIVEATMTWGFGVARKFTIVESLIVHELPTGAGVEVQCHGRGCPFAHARAAAVSHSRCHKRHCKRHPSRTASEVRLTGLFKGRHLGVGARILVNMHKPGWIGKSYRFTIRAETAPHVQITFGPI
jgi:hypothetical protein